MVERKKKIQAPLFKIVLCVCVCAVIRIGLFLHLFFSGKIKFMCTSEWMNEWLKRWDKKEFMIIININSKWNEKFVFFSFRIRLDFFFHFIPSLKFRCIIHFIFCFLSSTSSFFLSSWKWTFFILLLFCLDIFFYFIRANYRRRRRRCRCHTIIVKRPQRPAFKSTKFSAKERISKNKKEKK